MSYGRKRHTTITDEEGRVLSVSVSIADAKGGTTRRFDECEVEGCFNRARVCRTDHRRRFPETRRVCLDCDDRLDELELAQEEECKSAS